jgi:hypothetical protein
LGGLRSSFGVLALLVLAAPLSPGRASAASGVDWKNLPYLDYAGQHMWVATDASWTQSKVVNAHRFNLNVRPPTPFDQRGATEQWIWAAHCDAGRQFVSFSKTIMAYGAAYSGLFGLSYGPAGLETQRPYQSASLLINGTLVAHLGNIAAPHNFGPAIYGSIPPSALRAVQFGPNTLTVRVQKTVLPRGERCTIPLPHIGYRYRFVAVSAIVDMRFGAALTALPPSKSQVVHKLGGPGSVVNVKGSPSFRNDGPSASLSGTVTVSLNSAQGVTAFIPQFLNPPVGPPFGACTVDPNASLRVMTCPYQEFRAGTTIALPSWVGFKSDSSFPNTGMRTVQIVWQIQPEYSSSGPSGGSTVAHVDILLCGPTATDPACAG